MGVAGFAFVLALVVADACGGRAGRVLVSLSRLARLVWPPAMWGIDTRHVARGDFKWGNAVLVEEQLRQQRQRSPFGRFVHQRRRSVSSGVLRERILAVGSSRVPRSMSICAA